MFFKKAQYVYDALKASDGLYHPCVDKYRGERSACHTCSTTLEYTYLENGLYAIRCKNCGVVSLVQERCPAEATSKVGYEEMVIEE